MSAGRAREPWAAIVSTTMTCSGNGSRSTSNTVTAGTRYGLTSAK